MREASAAITLSSSFLAAPELLDAGRHRAADRGVELEWVEADAEALPFADAEFDVVMSCIGAMFPPPDHRAVADELLRVCRPGGVIGMINWMPEGTIGELFGVFARYAPPLPPGALPPTLWGSQDHVRELFGDRIDSLETTGHTLPIDHFTSPAGFCEYYKTNFGPTIATYAYLGEDPERVAALDRDFLEFAEHSNRGRPEGPALYEFDYLLVVARRATS